MWIFMLPLILVLACAPQAMEPVNATNDSLEGTHPISDTMGCQDNEVEISGTCTVHDDGNVMLFGEINFDELAVEETPYGYLARPKEGTYPGVIMIHEWWGLNENVKSMAHQLAYEGYVVLAVDLYEGKVAETPEQAREYVTAVRDNQEKATQTMREAVAFLRERPSVSEKIGSMGWCFGGGESLQLAISGEPMDATVIYYGQLTNDKTQLEKITWPVLGIFAGDDTGIPPSAVNAFQTVLNDLNIENDITIYPGVGHAFANPSGASFAPNETLDSWDKTIDFLNENLK